MAASAARIAEVLAGLRAKTACLEARSSSTAHGGHVALGIDAVDAALGGGLPRGRLSELIGPRGAGRLSLAVGALAGAQAAGEWVALVDAADAFDPRSAADAGVALDRLLWVRPNGLDDGLRAADRVLEAGGFALVVLYACGVRGRSRGTGSPSAQGSPGFFPQASAARLLRRAEQAKSAVLVVGERAQLGSFSAVTLSVSRVRAKWSRTLLDGIATRVEVTRNKLGAPGSVESIELACG